MDSVNGLVQRAKMEFLEMPGLALTLDQASRLWNVDRDVCHAVLAELVRERFLSLARTGAFLRRDNAA